MSQVNITLNTNTVEVNTTNNQIVVTDPTNPNVVNITQPVTSVVEVITAGPQGPPGPPGTGSIADTGSFVTTSSFNAFTSSYNTGSFTGSFTGSLFGTSSFAVSASWAPLNAGGSNTQIQFNSGSALRGTGSFNFNYQSQSLQQGLNVTASGLYSHAQGLSTRAIGNYSHAEGWITTASADYTHAEGSSTIASGLYSHAEGNNTQATGEASHAEGYGTLAEGPFSHAEGFSNQALGYSSHAEGQYSQAIGNYSHAEGNNTQAIGESSHAEGYLTISSGSYSHAEGYATIASGDYSHAEGVSTQAIGNYSHTEGSGTKTGGTNGYLATSIVSGLVTLSEDYGNVSADYPAGNYLYLNDLDYDGSISIGSFVIDSATFTGRQTEIQLINVNISTTTAVVGNLNIGASNWTGDQIYKGPYSHAEGVSTSAIGNYSHAEGEATQAAGGASHAEGYNTKTLGQYSHAEGSSTIASGVASHAEGNIAKAIGEYSHAEGDNTQAKGNYSHAEGQETISSGSYSHAEGYLTIASGDYSHAEGYVTVASGSYSHAEGLGTQALGPYSHAEGTGTIASGEYSHAEGFNTQALGDSSHAEGRSTTAQGLYSHAEGRSTTALAEGAHTEGFGTVASGLYQHVQGQYNISSSAQSAFIIGNGTADNARSNLVFASGSIVQVTGSLRVSGSITGSLFGTASFATSASWAPLNAGGSNTQIQFNSGSSLFGTGSFTFNYQSQSLQQGLAVTARGLYSHAEGSGTTASGSFSHAEGESGTIAQGQASHAEGRGTTAIGRSSHAEGTGTTASGSHSHAEGRGTQAIGDSSHAEGTGTIAQGQVSHAEGSSTQALGDGSHAEGASTQAIGQSSHAEGASTISSGSYSHAEGQSTAAIGEASHAEGLSTIALGKYSHAEGFWTVAQANYQHVQGQYNISSSVESAFIIGNGVTEGTRSNLVFASGNTFQITGSLNVSGSITGSLFGTASFAVSSSRAVTSSFAISASWAPSQTINTSSLVTTSSFNAFTSSYNTGSFTGSFIGDGSGLTNLPVQSINTSSFATTGSNTFQGTQTITGSNGRLIYRGTTPGVYPENTLAEVHANDDYPWLERFYNDTFSTSSAIMAYFGQNDGRFVFHNESTQSIGLQVNGFNAENGLLVYSDKVAFVNNVEVTGSLLVSGSITGSLFGTASWATNAITASYITSSNVYGPFGANSILSASYALTASYSKNLQISGSINNVDYIDFNTGSIVTQPVPGRLSWNDTDGTLDIGLKGGNVTLQIGQEEVARVVNKTGGNLLEADYRAVRVRSVAEGGAQGQRLAVVLAQADNDANSATTLGIVTEDISVNQDGFITLSGQVRGINTTGTLQGETWVDGDVLYLSPTTPGYLTNVKPQAPQHTVIVGYVEYAHNNQGKIFVKIDNGYEIDELHNVRINTGSLTSGQLLVRSGSVWINSNQLTGSYGLTGSLQATSFSGSFSGSGANLNSIPASAITGLNLSQIATGSVTASVSPTQFTVSSASIAEFTVTGTGVTLGSVITDTHRVTGSLNVSGAINIVGNLTQGFTVTASGLYSHAEGDSTQAKGNYSHAEGTQTISSGSYSHAEGTGTQALGDSSHAEGSGTVATGDYSHVEGEQTNTEGPGSHAEGYNTYTIGAYSHAEGEYAGAIGQASHAEGSSTVAEGLGSHAEGSGTTASGPYSHAEGSGTQAIGQGSHAEGFWTVAAGSYQHVQGQYNISSSAQSAFIIGNGTSSGTRSNLVFASGSQFQITGSLSLQGLTSQSPLQISSGSTSLMFISSSGDIGIRTTTPSASLHIVGSGSFAGLHLQNLTTASLGVPQNTPSITLTGASFQSPSSSLNQWRIFGAGSSGGSYSHNLTFQSITGPAQTVITPMTLTQNGGLSITNNLSAFSIGTTAGYTYAGATNASTTGTTNFISTTNTFNPTSGTGVLNYNNIAPTINQTGGANGIVRGVFINPTLTSAADFRALENTRGNNLLNSTSGNTYVGLSTNTGTARLQVRGTGATSSTNNLLLQNSSLTNLLTVRDDGSTILSGSLTISGSATIVGGSITMPDRPAFRVTGSASTDRTATTTLSGSAVGIDYNQGGYYNNTNGTFTAPIAGLYHIYLNARVGSANSQMQAIVYKNTNIVQLMWEAPGLAASTHFGVSGIVNLAVNDTLQLRVTVGSIQFDGNDSWGAAYIG